jgi:hypothetical protein
MGFKRRLGQTLIALSCLGYGANVRAQDDAADNEAPAEGQSQPEPRRAPQPAPGTPGQAYPQGYPPQGYPPQGYPPQGYPPPGYPPPPGYYPYPYPGYYPPPGAPPPPRERSYREGDPVPRGYRIEERTRRGPLIAGPIVFGVPYFIGLLASSAADYKNDSGWLVVPVIGPWATLAARRGCDSYDSDYPYDTEAECRSVRTLLIIDGVMQVTGAALFIWGLTSPKKVLVREDAWLPMPARIGSGYGLVSSAHF